MHFIVQKDDLKYFKVKNMLVRARFYIFEYDILYYKRALRSLTYFKPMLYCASQHFED